MTKIKMLNDRIIFDGHADSRQECETITLICDNLAKSKDFKTVRYESGYAEFEKVGQTNELKFAPPTECSCTMIFDDGVISVACAQDATGSQPSFTWNNSGESNTGYFEGECIFPVTLAPGRILDTVVSSEYNDYVVIDENQFQGMFTTGANFTITITTKAASGLKQVIDVSKLPGWVALAIGNHQITIKTKASGYVDSAASNAVTVSKAASGHKVYISGSQDTTMGGYAYYSTDNGATWEPLAGGYGWSATNELVGTFTQIKFEIDADADRFMPSCVLSSTALGLSLRASNGETQISDNYKLTEDITDLTFEAYGP